MFETSENILKIGRADGMKKAREAYIRLVRRYPPEHFSERFKKIKKALSAINLEDGYIAERISAFASVKTSTDLYHFFFSEAAKQGIKDQTDLDPLEAAMDDLFLFMILEADETSFAAELLKCLEEIQKGGLEWQELK